MKLMRSLTLGAALFVAACSNGSEPAASDATDDVENAGGREKVPMASQTDDASTPNNDKGTHPGGDAIELSGLREGDIPALDGEIGCSFNVPENKQSILIAKGDVDPKASVFGVYKVGDNVERIGGGPGGYDKLANGMRLGGQGMTLDVERTSTTSNDTANEGVSYPATLTLNRADGGKRVYTGTWNCGP